VIGSSQTASAGHTPHQGSSEYAAEALPTQASHLGNTYHTTRRDRLFFFGTIPPGHFLTLLDPLQFNLSKANLFIIATMVEKVYVTYNQVCILECYTCNDAESPARAFGASRRGACNLPALLHAAQDGRDILYFLLHMATEPEIIIAAA